MKIEYTSCVSASRKVQAQLQDECLEVPPEDVRTSPRSSGRGPIGSVGGGLESTPVTYASPSFKQ